MRWLRLMVLLICSDRRFAKVYKRPCMICEPMSIIRWSSLMRGKLQRDRCAFLKTPDSYERQEMRLDASQPRPRLIYIYIYHLPFTFFSLSVNIYTYVLVLYIMLASSLGVTYNVNEDIKKKHRLLKNLCAILRNEVL